MPSNLSFHFGLSGKFAQRYQQMIFMQILNMLFSVMLG